MTDMERKTNMKLSTRLLLLLCLMGAGLVVASVGSVLLSSMGLLTMLTVQDVLAFIVPAIVAMAIFYRRPLHAMCIDRAPSWRALVLVVVFYVVSLPAMNWLVEANQAMSLPSWMSGIEQMMRSLEDSAADATEQLLDINSVGKLLACLFVVGFMAGLSEEMLFRGAMQRTMHDSRLGIHAAQVDAVHDDIGPVDVGVGFHRLNQRLMGLVLPADALGDQHAAHRQPRRKQKRQRQDQRAPGRLFHGIGRGKGRGLIALTVLHA